ncbi:hypothetical protein [Actinopolyspora saharensis]|uniref:hypothetical protein n=1 Tax=Actinopolyspora saharensis TaxID=995062 RepID=UPI000B27F9CC|nr:hypothetical protein [Actinopolyspora saharensis]
MVDDRLNEEDEAKHVLSELHNLGVDHADFDSKFDSLAESVRAHADREEQKEFAQLRENVPEERLGSMAGAVRTAEAIAPTRPHPMAGESAAANVLAGPPAALFDRVRDAVRDWNKSGSG